MKMVKLKGGSEEPEGLVKVTMLVLRTQLEKDPILFYEIVMTARDPQHPPWANAPQPADHGGTPHDDLEEQL